MEELDKAKNEWDKASKALGSIAGSGPLNLRRGIEQRYRESHERYIAALKKEGITGHMYPKKKYRS